MDIRIIFLDLDYTLMDSSKSISDYTASTIRKVQEKGILVGFCTSRGATCLPSCTKRISPDFTICNAGACIHYKSKLIHTETFSAEDANKIFENSRLIFGPTVEMTCDTLDRIFWNKKNENKSDDFAPDSIYHDFMNFKEPAMKMCIQTTDMEKSQQLVDSVPGSSFIPFSDIPWIKVAPVTSTKENAIKVLCNRLNISLENTAAFGDDFTDMGMLKTCAVGVAMENAIPQVKEIADFITDSCDQDGVARWMEKFLLTTPSRD